MKNRKHFVKGAATATFAVALIMYSVLGTFADDGDGEDTIGGANTALILQETYELRQYLEDQAVALRGRRLHRILVDKLRYAIFESKGRAACRKMLR